MEEKIKVAQSSEGEELWRVVKLQIPDVMNSATLNRNLTDEMALFIVKSRNVPSETLGFLAGDRRFKDSYKLKLAICKNPKCPQRVALSLLKYLRLFDMADITRNQCIPVMLRQKVELIIMEKIPVLPSGIKVALSRRACSNIVVKLMERSDRKVVDACLDSPLLTEEYIYGLINAASTKPAVIRAIAEHPKWSLRYQIKFALVRNFNTPMGLVDGFLGSLRTTDLQYLHEDPKLPAATRPFIFRELKKRDEPLEPRGEETYVVSEEDDSVLDDLDLK